MFNNILSSGYMFEDDEYELKTKYILLNSILFTTANVLLFLGIFRFLMSEYEQAMIDFLVFGISLGYMVLLRKLKKGRYQLISYSMILVFTFVIIYSYYISNGALKINAWFNTMVIPIFFIFGFRIALLITLLIMAALATLHLNMGHSDIVNTLYGYVPLFMSVLFLNIYEWRFRKFLELLTDTNNNLEKKVKEKTQERTEVLQQQKNKLNYQAHHDYLTKLPNRVKLENEILKAIKTSEEYNKYLSILFIDLDHFKKINDSFGHVIGDEVLKIVAARIQNCIKNDDFLARFGGDEFVVFINSHKLQDDLEKIAENIIACISKPILIENKTMFVSCSIGISTYRGDKSSYQDLIKHADTAMYKAKESGRNTYQFYNSDMTKSAFERVLMETSMRFALEKEEFVVYYQPQVDTQTDKIIGMEALIRWNHETLGLVNPSAFVPLAEETGLILVLDQWMMKTAMIQAKTWYDMGYNPGRISLNLSVKQLQHKGFINVIKNMLNETGCKGEWIEFEITESHVMENVVDAISTLERIKGFNINIAIDDFGTGYSSLSYLKKLPVNKLKIDKSFIVDIPDNKEDAAITNAIIGIAESLNLMVIAEGVETVKQKNYLMQCGCRYVQGYLYYKPMESEKIEEVLKSK